MGDAALGHHDHRDGGGFKTIADSNIALDRIGGLSDLELAFLLCLINREHCIISTQPASLDDLVEELKLLSSRTFGLAPLVISCSPTTTLDDLAAGIVHPVLHSPAHAHAHVHRPLDFQTSSPTRSPSPMRSRLYSARTTSPPLHQPDQSSYFPSPGGGSGALTSISSAALPFGPGLGGNGNSHPPGTAGTFSPPAGGIANIILARNLDHAPRAVQVQVLELLRTRRIFTRTSVQTAPRPFLFVAVLSNAPLPTASVERSSQSRSRSRSAAVAVGPGTGTATASTSTHPSPVVSAPASHQTTSMTGLIPHLNDYFFIAHRHDALLDGFANLEEDWARANSEEQRDNGDSAETASVLRKSVLPRGDDATFSEDHITHLAHLATQVAVDIDVMRYQANITAFLRMNRAVAGGISPVSTKHLDRLMRSLAPLNNFSYVTPAIVALATRKVYLHRIRIAPAERERSMQWGSDLDAVRELLRDIGPEEVLEQVLSQVSVPV